MALSRREKDRIKKWYESTGGVDPKTSVEKRYAERAKRRQKLEPKDFEIYYEYLVNMYVVKEKDGRLYLDNKGNVTEQPYHYNMFTYAANSLHRYEKGYNKMNQSFYMLFAEGGNAPKSKHETVESAKKEAERILRDQKNVKKIYVLKTVSVMELPETPIKVTELL